MVPFAGWMMPLRYSSDLAEHAAVRTAAGLFDLSHMAEIVVTGPGAEPIASVEDLSGKEVYLRKSSSYHESIEKLNAELAQAGRAPPQVSKICTACAPARICASK
jgi:hypothetical protein